MKHTEASLDTVQQAVDYLYTDKEITLDAQSLSDMMSADIDVSATLLRYASWEIAHQSETWEELRMTVEALDKLRVLLFTSVLDHCAYRMLKADTADILRKPAAECHTGESSYESLSDVYQLSFGISYSPIGSAFFNQAWPQNESSRVRRCHSLAQRGSSFLHDSFSNPDWKDAG